MKNNIANWFYNIMKTAIYLFIFFISVIIISSIICKIINFKQDIHVTKIFQQIMNYHLEQYKIQIECSNITLKQNQINNLSINNIFNFTFKAENINIFDNKKQKIFFAKDNIFSISIIDILSGNFIPKFELFENNEILLQNILLNKNNNSNSIEKIISHLQKSFLHTNYLFNNVQLKNINIIINQSDNIKIKNGYIKIIESNMLTKHQRNIANDMFDLKYKNNDLIYSATSKIKKLALSNLSKFLIQKINIEYQDHNIEIDSICIIKHDILSVCNITAKSIPLTILNTFSSIFNENFETKNDFNLNITITLTNNAIQNFIGQIIPNQNANFYYKKNEKNYTISKINFDGIDNFKTIKNLSLSFQNNQDEILVLKSNNIYFENSKLIKGKFTIEINNLDLLDNIDSFNFLQKYITIRQTKNLNIITDKFNIQNGTSKLYLNIDFDTNRQEKTQYYTNIVIQEPTILFKETGDIIKAKNLNLIINNQELLINTDNLEINKETISTNFDIRYNIKNKILSLNFKSFEFNHAIFEILKRFILHKKQYEALSEFKASGKITGILEIPFDLNSKQFKSNLIIKTKYKENFEENDKFATISITKNNEIDNIINYEIDFLDSNISSMFNFNKKAIDHLIVNGKINFKDTIDSFIMPNAILYLNKKEIATGFIEIDDIVNKNNNYKFNIKVLNDNIKFDTHKIDQNKNISKIEIKNITLNKKIIDLLQFIFGTSKTLSQQENQINLIINNIDISKERIQNTVCNITNYETGLFILGKCNFQSIDKNNKIYNNKIEINKENLDINIENIAMLINYLDKNEIYKKLEIKIKGLVDFEEKEYKGSIRINNYYNTNEIFDFQINTLDMNFSLEDHGNKIILHNGFVKGNIANLTVNGYLNYINNQSYLFGDIEFTSKWVSIIGKRKPMNESNIKYMTNGIFISPLDTLSINGIDFSKNSSTDKIEALKKIMHD